ncbi:N-acyl-D-amino-acid deacylase family protein [Rhodobium gokarnense]|uniref:N-acyl-D-aspartate/D-glutamate deacylase n=1 Tax=Rhodobium gokarnense TaxID=364296 RepID=A0ABT3H682_9HYPH|nr:amidohydrolase family protein [Rhodobium gokarnense]MCW2305901.1 N-acyl-D-aspartate/D-glutamate deacylase [Rhodobium gokarnense]
MLDIVIRNGRVFDGTGADEILADIGIKDGRIAAIGRIEDAGEVELDAAGLAVSPGFIDLHTHSDFTLAANGKAESQVHQGVTTEVVGQCGVSCAPARNKADIELMAPGFTEGAVDVDWLSFADYLDHLDGVALGVNVAAFVGHGTIHRAVLGDALRPASDEEVDEMKALLEESLEGGAYGFSTGLEYWPGSLADPDQLTEMAKLAAKYDVLYATHVRNRDRFYDLGFGEALATARAAEARLQISHIQPKYGAPDYAMQHALEMCSSARARGTDVAFDVIPHDWSHTRVLAILPQWAQEGGVDAVRQRLTDPAMRARIKKNPRPMWRLVSAGIWDKIVLMQSDANQDLVGMTFDEIGRKRGADPYDAVLDLLVEEDEDMNQLMWTSQSFSEDDIELALGHDDCAVISDTLALAPYGCLKHHIGSLSGYGWAARFLQHYVRDRGVLTLGEALRRLTSLPAARLGIADRGTLKVGARADITVFDAKTIESHTDVDNPRRYATGVAHVMVNGGIAMRDGERTDVNSGEVLRRHG